MRRKHYTTDQVRRLLVRLLRGDPPAVARRTLTELLEARLGDVVVVGSAVRELQAAKDEQILEWLANVRRLLETSVHLGGFRIGHRIVTTAKVTISATSTQIELSGAAQSMLLAQACALVRSTAGSLRVCECGQLFVKEGKQQYCSIQCQRRYYMRKYRAGEVGGE